MYDLVKELVADDLQLPSELVEGGNRKRQLMFIELLLLPDTLLDPLNVLSCKFITVL